MSRERFHGMVEKAVEYIRAATFPDRAVAAFVLFARPFAFIARFVAEPVVFVFPDFGARGDGPSPGAGARGGKVTIRRCRHGAARRPKRQKSGRIAGRPRERAEQSDAGFGPQRRRPGRQDRHRQSPSTTVEYYSTSCISPPTSRARSILHDATTPVRGLPAAPFPARRSAAMEIIEELEPNGAASMPSASAISGPTARWTPASRCGPR